VKKLSLLISVLLLGWLVVAQAAIEVYQFDDSAKEQRFKQLSHELRCLVCQNESLADSNAELAQDLRHQIYKMVQKGSSDKEIVDFMVSRYGDFVLYNPPLKASTYLLWFGPFVLVVVGLYAVIRFVRRTGRETSVLSEDEQQRVEKILEDSERPRPS
jgi:cytochrome c-type biogenesis protein CcmH